MTEIRTQKQTVRRVVAQVLVCNGCCCGRVEKGKPEVPVDWLKAEWKRQGLLKRVQLTITACLGPCDVPNVVSLLHEDGSIWLGSVSQREQYAALIDWAVRSRDLGRLAALPEELAAHTMQSPFQPIRQTDSP